ncbi:hypothetical protein ACFV9G_17960, partial [Nocardioides sp. NPDC059952]|uniref:hypothetical protein n=1 Tax=Nocardioides sp. NPDC059952 TaxID=3347014 RepID=UPI003666659B
TANVKTDQWASLLTKLDDVVETAAAAASVSRDDTSNSNVSDVHMVDAASWFIATMVMLLYFAWALSEMNRLEQNPADINRVALVMEVGNALAYAFAARAAAKAALGRLATEGTSIESSGGSDSSV